MSAGQKTGEDFLGMAAVADGAVDGDFAGLGASAARISATMIGRCEPAGVLPAAITFATVWE